MILALVCLHTLSAATPSPPSTTYAFLRGDGAFTAEENLLMTRALTSVGTRMGHTLADPKATLEAVTSVEAGSLPDGKRCGVPVTSGDAREAAVAQRLGLCANGACTLREARWNAECRQQWQACSVTVAFPSADEKSSASTVRHGVVFPEATARAWRSVADLAKALEALPAGAWKPITERSEGGALLGGLGMRSSAGATPGALREKVPQKASVETTVHQRVSSAETVWSLLLPALVASQQPEPLVLEDAVSRCWLGTAASQRVTVLARRGPDGGLKVSSDADESVKACVEKGVLKALVPHKDVTAWSVSLVNTRADVLTSNGAYVVDVQSTRQTRQGTGWERPPVVSDPALAGWHAPSEASWASCLVNYPFTNAHAAEQKRVTVDVSYTVTFDALGAATAVQFAPPLGEPFSAPARACLEKVALESRAPCSSAGGTAVGVMKASTYTVKKPVP